MKIIYHVIFIGSLVSLAGCTQLEKTNISTQQHASMTQPIEQMISGKVLGKIEQGKDGSVWEFQADNGEIYSLLLSIPNLGPVGSKALKSVASNSRLKVKGRFINLGDEQRLIAQEIELLQ